MTTFGIDANVLTLSHVTGTERYVSSLLTEMMRTPLAKGDCVFLYVSRSIFSSSVLPDGWEEKVLHWPLKHGWTHGRLSIELTTRAPDVFFSPAHEIPLFPGKAKIVTTIHDVAFKRVPDVYSEKSRKRQEWAVSRAIKLSKKILTVSLTTKNDLLELYDVKAENIVPSLLAITKERFHVSTEDAWRVRDKYRLPQLPFCISVGRIEKKKNIAFLIEACIKANQSLVLAGSFGFGKEEIEPLILSSRGLVQALGYVPDEDLPGLLANANAYVFPSRYEGFGIPALEAMASQLPLIASDIKALREVAGDAAIFLDTADVDAWIQAFSLLKDEEWRQKMIARGNERVEMFSWEKTAKITWDTLRGI